MFVIMPFVKANSRTAPELDELFEASIKSPLEAHAFGGFRLSVSRSSTRLRITDEILAQLRSADYVIADLSGHPPNPNVMFELGVRFAVSHKPVIFIRADHPDNVAIFDVSTLHTFRYKSDDTRDLQRYLVDKIEAFESGGEHYVSPVIGSLDGAVMVRERAASRARRALAALSIDDWFLMYANVVVAACEAERISTRRLADALRENRPVSPKILSAILRVESRLASALGPPAHRLPDLHVLREALEAALPAKLVSQVTEVVETFEARFRATSFQWVMASPLLSAVQMVEAGLLRSFVLESAGELIDIALDGMLSLKRDGQALVAVDHLEFALAYSNYKNDYNAFLSRMLAWARAGDVSKMRKA